MRKYDSRNYAFSDSNRIGAGAWRVRTFFEDVVDRVRLEVALLHLLDGDRNFLAARLRPRRLLHFSKGTMSLRYAQQREYVELRE